MDGDDRQHGGGGNGQQHWQKAIPHGTRCDCKLLAEALHMDSSNVSYEYCRNALQRRWRITCRHGELMPAANPANPVEKWKDLGEMTPLNALLVQNV
jgi:hypothetical protein